jgi:hypothetical protein
MSNIDREWKEYLSAHQSDRLFSFISETKRNEAASQLPTETVTGAMTTELPKCEDLYISTKTKALYLNQELDIHGLFWQIPVLEYWRAESGVVNKQIKVVSNSPEEFEAYQQRLVTTLSTQYYHEQIIKQIFLENSRRSKYRDERKLTVGISKKDILNARGKKKNAFYNCFALILRFRYEDMFREIHVKVFNTGKMEIPGVLNQAMLDRVTTLLMETLRPLVGDHLAFVDNVEHDGVLINSNFHCGFAVHRDRLFQILRSKYNLEVAYDSCSYPGIKCKFYFNHDCEFDVEHQRGFILDQTDRSQKLSELGKNAKYTEVSFMIFRTGSCLIVGNCSEAILHFIYEFLKRMFAEEYPHIYCAEESAASTKTKKTSKVRKTAVQMTVGYINSLI